MDREEIQNLFEVPTLENLDFSFKQNLSNLYTIIKSLKSKLDIESNSRQGTRFVFYAPIKIQKTKGVESRTSVQLHTN